MSKMNKMLHSGKKKLFSDTSKEVFLNLTKTTTIITKRPELEQENNRLPCSKYICSRLFRPLVTY